ncbi:MAG TPA: FHA domain-containing protein [Xanthomonadaceae bacterium]|nr:FHA domain-containing protein [Xanthomonadaceae bacterium]
MSQALESIDLAPLKELTGIRGQIDTLNGRLGKMEERKDAVAGAVYQRVREDYRRRLEELEERAEPLRRKGREEYAKLREFLVRTEAEHHAIGLDREEIEFRHSLGEFDDKEHAKRIKEIEVVAAEKSEAKQQADALKEKFVEAFGSIEAVEAESEAPAAQPEPAAEPPADATQKLATLPPEGVTGQYQAVPEAATPKPAPAGATQVMRAIKGDEGAPVRADQTVILRTARLVPQNPEAGKKNITLALKPMLIGSDTDCDVHVTGAQGKHAEIRVSMAGFTMSNLGGGIRVNGVAVEQHLLRHDDVIEIGPGRFAFREG